MKAKAFEELLASVRQLRAIRRGDRTPSRTTTFKPTDVKALRATLAQPQAEFALMIGVSVATLRNWEQGRPTGRRSRYCKSRRTIRRPSSKRCTVRADAVRQNLALLLTGPSRIVALLAALAGHILWNGPAAERAH